MQTPSFLEPTTTTTNTTMDAETDIDTPSNQPSSPPATPRTPPNLPYTISRTTSPSKNLPIYESTKSRTLHITTIRRCSGDLSLLRDHLLQALNLEASFIEERDGKRRDNVKVNEVTKSVVVRGWRGAEVKRWCGMVGF